MGKTRRFTIVRALVALVFLVVFFFIWLVSYEIGEFKKYLDAFSGDIVRGDQLAAKDGMADLRYFYELNNKLKPFGMDGLANKYLFKDNIYYQAAIDYLAGNHDTVIEKLKNEDNYWAYYLRANSQWRRAQGVMAQALTLKDPIKKA